MSQSHGASKVAVFAALIGNSLVALTKFIAAGMTGSSAMLSEGIHSVVDTGNQILLLYGLRRANRPPDEDFPFGYGKEVYFWSFVVAILIFAVGSGISLYEGIIHLAEPQHLDSFLPNYIVLGLAILFEGGALYIARREFAHTKGNMGYFEAVRHCKDPTLFVVLFEDSAALLGLFAALTGVGLTQITGNPIYDAAASITVGIILGATAIWLAYETKGLLIGESARREVVRGIRSMAQALPAVLHVNEVLTVHMGPEFILVNLSLEFRDSAAVPEVETIIAGLDRDIKAAYPLVRKVFIEAEPMGRVHHKKTNPQGNAC